MDIPSSKFHAWKAAEAELSDIERTFRAMASDLTSADRETVTAQLAALKLARLRVRLLFEEVMSESALTVQRLAEEEEESNPGPDAQRHQGEQGHWLL